jgi:hypothetical protein
MAVRVEPKRPLPVLAALLLGVLLGCGNPQAPAPPQAGPSVAGRVVTVNAAVTLLEAPGGAPLGEVAPGEPLSTLASRADGAGVVWLQVRTRDGGTGWLPESRLRSAGEEGAIATH